MAHEKRYCAGKEHPEHEFNGVGEHGTEKRVRARRIHGC